MSTLTPRKIDSTLKSYLSSRNYLKTVEKASYGKDFGVVDIKTLQNWVDLNISFV
jgi:hypothetical protein